jgi:hypothetical protein
VSDHGTIELFTMKCAVAETELRKKLSQFTSVDYGKSIRSQANNLDTYIKQFDIQNRQNAARMSFYYEIFYMLENDIRTLIIETMEAAHHTNWPAPGSADTELGVLMEPEVSHGEAEVYTRVQA